MKPFFALLLAACCFSYRIDAQTSAPFIPLKEHMSMLRATEYAAAPQAKASKATSATPIFDTNNWQHIIDSTWGQGLADTAKLSLFNQFWTAMDSAYACFVKLPNYNWDSIVNAMRTEITMGVSRGRFAGIIGKLLTYVNDGHTSFYDYTVDYSGPIYPGKPVFRRESGLFGACITAVNDTTAMVYEAVAGHPFNLQPGDVILGYNNIPWTKLIQVLLRHQLPAATYVGSSDAATYHRYVQAAGENWYLFDTINIRKCDGSLVNYPTSLMVGHNYSNFCTEQMPVQGIHKLSGNEYYSQNISYSSGVITGTHIGYVYMYDCGDGSGDSLYNRVRTLVEDSLVNGLIIDIRTNFGGSFLAFEKAFEYLNNGDVSWLGYGERSDPHNRLSMMNTGLPAWYDVTDSDPMFFQGPVAVLCGPNAVSAGDVFSVLFKHDPTVRTFGLSTAGAFGAYYSLTMPYANYYASRQAVNFFEASNPTYYLSHTEFPIDQKSWFTQNSVCNGTDQVVDDAIHWIWNTTKVEATSMSKFEVTVMPNPSSGECMLEVISRVEDDVHIRICNSIGAVVQSFSTGIHQGRNRIDLQLEKAGLPPGNYIVLAQTGTSPVVSKKLQLTY